jgi:hypothetical protein
VIPWLRDIQKWAQIVRFFVKDAGFFYMMESHPFSHIFDDETSGPPKIHYSYFASSNPSLYEAGTADYSARDYLTKHATYEWTWALSDVVNSLLKAGFEIQFLNEYDKAFYKALPDMVQDEDGWWDLPAYRGKIPFTFTLKATPK